MSIRNLSPAGLYFESVQRLTLRTNIDIFIDDDDSSLELLKEGRHFKAQVKWLDKAHAGPAFGAGAEIVSKTNRSSRPMPESYCALVTCADDTAFITKSVRPMNVYLFARAALNFSPSCPRA